MRSYDLDGGSGSALSPESPERRANQRYDVELEFDLFHLWGASHLVWAGSGRTLNWSRNSILIAWNRPLASGSSVELVVRWCSGVQLVVVGRVLASGSRGSVVKIIRRRFRGKPEFASAASVGGRPLPPLVMGAAGQTRAS